MGLGQFEDCRHAGGIIDRAIKDLIAVDVRVLSEVIPNARYT